MQNNAEYRRQQIPSQITEWVRQIANSNLKIVQNNQQAMLIRDKISANLALVSSLQLQLPNISDINQLQSLQTQLNTIMNQVKEDNTTLNSLLSASSSGLSAINHYNGLVQNSTGISGNQIDKNYSQAAANQSLASVERIKEIAQKIQTEIDKINQIGNQITDDSKQLCVYKRGPQFWKNDLNNISSNFSNKNTIQSTE